jgi:hypothetical protein
MVPGPVKADTTLLAFTIPCNMPGPDARRLT